MFELPHIGDVFIGRLRIDAVLGEGGFATVYQALDLSSQRSVALKVLKPDTPRGYDPSTAARVRREIQIVAQLRCPHTVTLFDHGASPDGLMYMVFEHVPGEDLSALLARAGRLPPAAVVHILRQLLLSLREAHEAGALHRDMKPQNVRVFEYAGDPLQVKLLDFGIARSTDFGSPSLTKTGELIGTPRYMSPEQLTDKPLTPASDIYSLGMMTLELLVGSDVLGGNALSAQFERLMSGHLFSIPEMERVGMGLGAIITRMTARKPEDRFASAASVLAALDELEPAPAAPIRRDQSATSASAHDLPATSGRKLSAILATLLVAIAAMLAFIFWKFGQSEPPPLPPPKVRPIPGIVAVPAAVEDVASPVVDVGSPSEDAGSDADLAVAEPSGCGSEVTATGWDKIHVETDFERDQSLIYVPPKYDENVPAPLVVVLHQVAESPAKLLPATKFQKFANRDGWLLIAPETATGPVFSWTKPELEATRIRRFVAETRRRYCVDENRIFVVGNGQGGRMAHIVGCEPWAAAVASNSFRPAKVDSTCDTAKPLITFSPLHSRQEPVEGGLTDCLVKGHAGGLQSLAEAEAMWRKRNGCSGKERTTRQAGCVTWKCDAPFESCRVDGGHGWPGVPERFDPMKCDGEVADFPTGARIWQFFKNLPIRANNP